MADVDPTQTRTGTSRGVTDPPMDFLASSAAVRAVVEGERLGYGHLYNPTFAIETSLIDPLPHQRLAVYEHMVPQPRLRFLLADDAGAGKTIMTGLYVREMLSRRLISRILIVPPAGLVGNWQRELHALFGLDFVIVRGSEMRGTNPFMGPASNCVIVSVDTLAGERAFGHLQDAAMTPYDLVIFDEAHKLAADRESDFSIRKTDRYRLGEALAGIRSDDPRWQLSWSVQHLLLLTATPHMGKEYPYFYLWRLLEPEALSTKQAFDHYPADARQRHFIRRTKEEMVRYDGTPIYPERRSDTLSYTLTQGAISEQTLYDETTRYITESYNLASSLNRSAARLVMSVFQRRMASSTYALLCSFRRRHAILDDRIAAITANILLPPAPVLKQDTLLEKTADEEEAEDGREENEINEDTALTFVAGRTLEHMYTERAQVAHLIHLAEQVEQLGDEAKFVRLREILKAPEYAQEKLIIFTEHRNTLEFLVKRLEGLGFSGQVVQLHGGMDYQQREIQVARFKLPLVEGGAKYLIATDAAGEGINLQFCWLMINYDIPWNPARLEQRMGRIHRYGQKHNPVIIMNLVAGATREGRVMKTLLDKLEMIRRDMHTDKVFDVIGELFEGVSIRDYMEAALTEHGADDATRSITGTLTKEQVVARESRHANIYGHGGDVRSQLPRLNRDLAAEVYRRLMPGDVRHFIATAAPLIHLEVTGDLNSYFGLAAQTPGALDTLQPLLEKYPSHVRERLTVNRPDDREHAIFLHPGEPFFEALWLRVWQICAADALRGGVFVDPAATAPSVLHIAQMIVRRAAYPAIPTLERGEVVARRLIGLREDADGTIAPCPIEYLLLLGAATGISPVCLPLLGRIDQQAQPARRMAQASADLLSMQCRETIAQTVVERQNFVKRAYDYQESELANQRNHLRREVQAGNAHAKGELTKVKQQQDQLVARKVAALAAIAREPDLVEVGDVTFIAHALIAPSNDPTQKRQHDRDIEIRAVHVVTAYEQSLGATVIDVSQPELARLAGLPDWPGFDLLARYPDGLTRNIEVKGRAREGDVIMSENEYARACNLRDSYWLYVVYDCASIAPRLLRVRDPFGKLIVRATSVTIDVQSIVANAEG